MTDFVLMDAISCLDLDLLEKHLKQKERLKIKKKRRVRTIQWTSIAACMFVFVIMSVVIYILKHPNLEGPSTYYYLGDTVENSKGSLTLVSIDDDAQQVTFYFVKKSCSKQYVLMRGHCITDEFVEDGVSIGYTIKGYDFISPYDWYRSNHGYEVIDDMLMITVNGVKTNAMPTEKGAYEIVIDYSKCSEFLDYIEPMMEIHGFGPFVIDKNYFGE